MTGLTGYSGATLAFVLVVVFVGASLLGRYLAATFRGGKAPGDRVFLPVENSVYRVLRIDPDASQTWKGYALAVLVFGLVTTLFIYLVLRLQGHLPGNPAHAPGMSPALSFNTAASFVTGTNWQAYEGETAASYLSNMIALVIGQFTAAAVGVAVVLAVIRGIAGSARRVGNFWADLTRSTVRVFLPLSIIGALVLVSQGVIETLAGFRTATTVAGGTQTIPGGPVATMEVIKLLGTNGGSPFGAGGAHPFENPTGFSNIFELLLVIVLPFGIALMFGRLIGRKRQGRIIFTVMLLLWAVHTLLAVHAEPGGNVAIPASISQQVTATSPGGNLEGKEVRFGPDQSALMTVGTMGTTAGATDSALDSYTPLGGGAALIAIVMGEVSPGGDGGGLYSMLIYVVIGVFAAGLMVGRTPEFLGKKIRGPQMKLAVAYVLAIPTTILALGSLSLVITPGSSRIGNPGMHGLTEVIYAFASSTVNNGSAFAALSSNTPWYNTTLGLAMLAGRFIPIVLALAIAGSLAGARVHASTRATLDTSGATFGVFLFGVVIIIGALVYFPVMILGPIGERLTS